MQAESSQKRVKRSLQLQPKFKFGTATSSYQIEGAIRDGNRGVSIWDTFCDTPGKVKNGDTGEFAIDHFHRFQEDISLMAQLGVQSYRFSIAWPRLFPRNMNELEPQGINLYNRIIDELLSHSIEPAVTLYHWDLPQYLEDSGGWTNRDTAFAFGTFARTCAREFGDRVHTWVTLNEPWCITYLGYYMGNHAPGVKDLGKAVSAAHHTALAHGIGARAIKEVRPDALVGLTVNMNTLRTDVDADVDKETNDIWKLVDAYQNRWWIDAYMTGAYPPCLVEEYGSLLSRVILPGDAELLRADSVTDFLGVNYYSDGFVGKARDTDGPINVNSPFPFNRRANLEMPLHMYCGKTDFDWPITPQGLTDLLLRTHRDWPDIKSIVITENGCAYNDEPDPITGEINDHRRAKYLTDHLSSVQLAIAQGVPVHGYFCWSLLDNFEWAEGYSKRFGIVHVDFVTQKRTPKLSYYVYKDIIAAAKIGSFDHDSGADRTVEDVIYP